MKKITKLALYGVLIQNEFTFEHGLNKVRLMGEEVVDDESFVGFKCAHAYRKIKGKYLHILLSVGHYKGRSEDEMKLYYMVSNSKHLSAEQAGVGFEEMDDELIGHDLVDKLENMLFHLTSAMWEEISVETHDTAPPGFIATIINIINSLRRFL